MIAEQGSPNAGRTPNARSVLMLAIAVLMFAACKDRSNASQVSFAPSETTVSMPAAATTGSNGVQASQNSYAPVVERVSPAVVTVRAASRARAQQQQQQPPFLDDPAFREYFGDRLPQQQQPRRQSSLGSGVIVTADGYILTNHHVVDGAEKITVEMTDRRTFEAKVVGSDQPSDLAVLKINASGLPVVSIGNSDQVRVGDVVLAVGNPLGIGQTVTSGIISAKSRATGVSDGSFEDFLQTDAAINTGNSGGALINTSGELIGINSQILSPSGGNIGIGFAIPTNMARTVMDQLIKTGKVRRGQLGVVVQNIDADLASSLELKDVRGVIVNSISAGSAAERAGIRQGDVLLAFNGNAVADSNTLRNNIAANAPGTEVTLTVQRDGRVQQFRATLGEFNAETARAGRGGENSGGNSPFGSSNYGMTLRPLTPEQATQLGLDEGAQGLLVTNVEPSGAAADAGVQPRDVIEQVNRQPVRSVDQLKATVERSGSRPALLLINRRGQSAFLSLRAQ